MYFTIKNNHLTFDLKKLKAKIIDLGLNLECSMESKLVIKGCIIYLNIDNKNLETFQEKWIEIEKISETLAYVDDLSDIEILVYPKVYSGLIEIDISAPSYEIIN